MGRGVRVGLFLMWEPVNDKVSRGKYGDECLSRTLSAAAASVKWHCLRNDLVDGRP